MYEQLTFIEPSIESVDSKIELLKQSMDLMRKRLFADMGAMKRDVDFLSEQIEHVVAVIEILTKTEMAHRFTEIPIL